MSRRLPIVGVVLVALVVLVAAGRDRPEPAAAVFSRLPPPSMPFVPTGSFISGSWFCPGVPAAGGDVRGEIAITNAGDRALQGRITYYSTDPAIAPITDPLSVEPRSTHRIDVTATVTADYVSALVEIDGGGGMVEQRAIHPAGQSVVPCSNAASSTWYFADGFTKDGSAETILLTNPYPDKAVVDVRIVTSSGPPRSPRALQGRTIDGESVMAISIAPVGVRDEEVVAIEVISSRNRIVAGRAQHYLGGGRLGFAVTLGVPSLNDQWYFAQGAKGPGIGERFSVYNPTGEDVDVDVVFLGIAPSDTFANDTVLNVPAGRVVVLDPSQVPGLPDGDHAVVFSTLSARAIVVERALTRGSGVQADTAVVAGAPATHASRRWYVPSGVAATSQALVVANIDAVDAQVTVAAIGPGGEVPLPGLQSVVLPASSVIRIPISVSSVFGDPLVVTATTRVYVERDLGRALGSSSFGLPQ